MGKSGLKDPLVAANNPKKRVLFEIVCKGVANESTSN